MINERFKKAKTREEKGRMIEERRTLNGQANPERGCQEDCQGDGRYIRPADSARPD